MNEDLSGINVSKGAGKTYLEMLHPFFQGGEKDGNFLHREDVSNILADALKTILYQTLNPQLTPRRADRTYLDNASFWKDALSNKHFPGVYIVLEDFHLMEWLPFSPGRYFTREAMFQRERAAEAISMDRKEYLPEGKSSMVRGGIGAIRLAGKNVDRSMIYFLGASSTGIAHQGIPIALPLEEYRKVMPAIKEHGGCRVKLVGYLQSMNENLPSLHYDSNVPCYCLFIEEVTFRKASEPSELLTTVATMFTAKEQRYRDTEKSWTFCSFNPSSSERNAKAAAEWLLDYAIRYSQDEPTILIDFDEHYRLFPCRVEFPISDIVGGKVDWQTLRVYQQRYGGTYIGEYIKIGTYIKENIKVEGDQIKVTGSGNTIVNRSTVQNAFNTVKAEYDEETAKALILVEEEINKSGNREAAENFESFSEELSKPEPRKSLLKTLWKGTIDALPILAQLTGVVSSIVKLFS